MDLPTAIFNALMRMTPHKTDTESRDARATRMHVLATAIDRAGRRAACVDAPPDCKPIFGDRRLIDALLLGKGHFESDFAEYVHEGRCEDGPRGARCDGGRAHGPWQQWRVSTFPASDWDDMVGSNQESTDLAAWHAARLLSGSKSMCKAFYGGDPVESAIAGFSGSCTRMEPAKVAYQAQAVRKILALLPSE